MHGRLIKMELDGNINKKGYLNEGYVTKVENDQTIVYEKVGTK